MRPEGPSSSLRPVKVDSLMESWCSFMLPTTE